jgi:hypothetical protein
MKLGVTLDILNQKGTPAFNADTLSNRPAAGFTGRMFISTDTFAFYRDTGTSWDLIGGPGSGTITGSGAAGQVTYFNGTSSITGTNNLFWDTANNRLGVNTNTPTASFDVHGTTNVIAQLNQLTSGQNALLTFQDNSVGKWRLGNIYNAAAHDFGIVDITNTLQRLTIKNTGQTFIGAEVTSSGLFVVNSATSDNHIVVTGANAPSIRLNNGSSVKQGGIAISTATNNFIQGSADRDFCVFNSSTTASPILFGVWNGTNTQEAARISTARNFIIRSSTDTGQALQVTGTTYISGFTGIGTTTAQTNLQVTSGVNSYAALFNGNAGTNGVAIGTLTGNYAVIQGYTSTFSATNNIALQSAGGFVGIGTTTPNAKLDVLTTASSAAEYQLSLRNGAGANNVSAGVAFGFNSSSIDPDYLGAISSIITNRSTRAADLTFLTAATGSLVERMRVTSGGNVLIGTSTNGASKLRIVGLPTSAVGLSSGDVYSNAGILTIVP